MRRSKRLSMTNPCYSLSLSMLPLDLIAIILSYVGSFATSSSCKQLRDAKPDSQELPRHVTPTSLLCTVKLVVMAAEMKYSYHKMLKSAAKHGHKDVVLWFKYKIPFTVNDFYEPAASAGHVSLLRIAEDLRGAAEASNFACYSAARRGHLSVLEWQSSMFPNKHVLFDSLILAATRGGHIHILEWAIDNKQNMHPLTPSLVWRKIVANKAAAHGHVHVLKWLKALAHPPPFLSIEIKNHVFEQVSSIALRRGHHNVIEFARDSF